VGPTRVLRFSDSKDEGLESVEDHLQVLQKVLDRLYRQKDEVDSRLRQMEAEQNVDVAMMLGQMQGTHRLATSAIALPQLKERSNCHSEASVSRSNDE
jgi:hypothetical protein